MYRACFTFHLLLHICDINIIWDFFDLLFPLFFFPSYTLLFDPNIHHVHINTIRNEKYDFT